MPLFIGVPYQPYSFLIKKLDDLIIAQNDKGRIQFSGTDASTIIQSAINALPNGGKIFLKEGTYPISTVITLAKGVSLIGEGSESIFPEVLTFPVTKFLWIGGSGETMLQTKPAEPWTGMIKNIHFHGVDVAGVGLNLMAPQGAIFENLHIEKFTVQGVLLHTLATVTGNAILNTFINFVIENCANIGFGIDGADSGHPVTLNTFINCRFQGKNVALRFVKYIDTNLFIGGRVEALDYNWAGIILNDYDKPSPSGVSQNIFLGVTIDGFGANADGVEINYAEKPHQFTNCVWGGTFANKVQIQNNGKAQFANCLGYITENSGTASGPSPITIPQTTHLLDVDPTYVNAVSKTSGYYVISVSYDPATKDITIEHSGGATSIDVFWEAKA